MRAGNEILVVGGGVAGLTVARSLALRGHTVRVLEKGTRRIDRGLGLWGRAHVALRELGLHKLLDCPRTTLRIPAAAYRSRDGKWLSRCSDTPANRTRVSTLRESALLRALEDAEGLPRPLTVDRGVEVIGMQQAVDGIEVRLSDGRAISGSVVVGADGANSIVRRLTFGGGGGGPGASGMLAAACDPIDTGFVAHGGILEPPSLGTLSDRLWPAADGAEDGVPQLAFETLSAGRRFALVPLADGGAFWFATRPLACGAADERADAGALGALRAAYEGWHAPIPQVLHAAACAAAEEASRRRGHPPPPAPPSLAHAPSADAIEGAAWSDAWSDAFRSSRVLVAPPLPRWWCGRAVLVGDAAHAMPINLAQGAALGIEGAWLLGAALGRMSGESGGGGESRGGGLGGMGHGAGHGEGLVKASTWQAAFESYQAAHEPRVRQCRRMTAFTAALAMPATAPTEALRDAMRLVPQPLNGAVFDAALEYSLGDWPSGTRSYWPLPTAPAFHNECG